MGVAASSLGHSQYSEANHGLASGMLMQRAQRIADCIVWAAKPAAQSEKHRALKLRELLYLKHFAQALAE